VVLRRELKEYDGKSTAMLDEIAHRWSQQPTYLSALLDTFATDNMAGQNGASWLFKSFVEKGRSIPDDIGESLARQVGCLSDWSAMLHVCQSIQHLTFAEVDARMVGDWSRQLLTNHRPFLRAWALDALVHLSSFDPTLRPDTETALEQAREDTAASVRARARNLKLSDGR